MTPVDARLLDLADTAEVVIEYAPHLPADRDGDYHHPSRTIRLRPGMHARLRRSVLAHELGHAAYGHIPSRFSLIAARQEREAEEWGARQLITLDDYRAAEEARHGHLGAMALDLDVMRSTVAAYAAMLERIGPSVYLRPRLGEHQWDARVRA